MRINQVKTIIIFFGLISSLVAHSQYSRQDTLRGTVTPERAWWDVLRYDIDITPDYHTKTITGNVVIGFKVTAPSKQMQIDLQSPMLIDVVKLISGEGKNKKSYSIPGEAVRHEGNAWFLQLPTLKVGTEHSLHITYHGKPREARSPPWDGGWVWAKDAKGRPWMTVACQGIGASVWYPCKDHQSDEPDLGASLSINVHDTLVAVGNGRLVKKSSNGNKTSKWTWSVKNPINSYNIIPYIGKYSNWTETFPGKKGKLDCSYWVMDYNLDRAKQHFGRDIKPMLECFEEWFGPYPFYQDSYKMVEAPHLGMEHQSAIAYGNAYMDGYLGNDLSGTGWGNKFDFIIIHESGHEWFGNNITTKDIADMWVHEGFTNYSEVLYVECRFGKKAADEYCQGLRSGIGNDRPIIGDYGVNNEGSGDMYAKGANLIHTIRQLIDNDSKFKSILKGLNQDFHLQTVSSRDIENYISRKSGMDLSKVFDQYLRDKRIPQLEYSTEGEMLRFRWTNCIAGFNMPLKVNSGNRTFWINPTEKWQTMKWKGPVNETSFQPDRNFYITSLNVINPDDRIAL